MEQAGWFWSREGDATFEDGADLTVVATERGCKKFEDGETVVGFTP